MIIFDSVSQIQAYLIKLKSENKSIGFVPTMGALHQGHISLIQEAQKINQIVVCSIFVNPTQFNNANDFAKYPLTLLEDCKKLENVHCNILFAPSVQEIYPNGTEYNLKFEIRNMDTIWDGAFRPGHFKGMIQVVARLLQIIQPNNLYMGLKDLQQFLIVKKYLKETQSNIQIHGLPTLREPSGLALSSRNVRILNEHKTLATQISQHLFQAKNEILSGKNVKECIQKHQLLFKNLPFRLEYFELVNTDNLKSEKEIFPEKQYAIIFAAWLGEVRLIDNVLLN
jgi:pantoate--beta-alanine ligase